MKIWNFMSKGLQFGMRTVRRFDLFSQNIKLTYKGESSFSTVFGGLVSIVILTAVGIYSAFLLQDMVNRENANTSKSTEVVDLNTNDENYYLTDYGFMFAVAITDTNGKPVLLDPTYLSLEISETNFTQINGYYVPQNYDLGYKLWSSEDLPGLSTAYVARGLSSSLYCPVNKRYKIAGNYLSNNYRYVSITLNKWQGAAWKSDAEINAVIQQTVVSIVYLNSYMDFNDFKTPVKSYVDDRVYFNLQPNYQKFVRIYAKLNKATLNDDYFKVQSSNHKKFFSVDRIQNDVRSHDSQVLNTSIMMDPNRDLYQRSVFSILDLFGTVGGIFGLLTSSWGLIVGMISVQLMLSSVFTRLYYTDSSNEVNSFKINVLPNTLVTREENKTNIYQDKTINVSKSDSTSECNLQTQNSTANNQSDEVILSKLANTLKTRRKYKAHCMHKLLTLLPCPLSACRNANNK